MNFTISIILEAHIYMILVVLFSFIVERLFGFKLLIDDFTWKKSDRMALASANIAAIFYFIISLGTLVYNVYARGNAPEDYSFWQWLLIVLPLTVLVRMAYYRLQARDPSKKGMHHD